MSREILISKDGYSLSRILGSDRDDYVELQRQINGDNTFFLNPLCKDMMWESVLNDSGIYILIDEDQDFCGSVELKGTSRTPEIGISILEKYRNQGIAAKAVGLLINLTFNPELIDYYVARIEEQNSHSRHVFEKMGAICPGEDLSTKDEFEAFLDKDGWSEKQKSEMVDLFVNHEGNANVVSYKLEPEHFFFQE